MPTKEEVTDNLMKHGYILDIQMFMWLGLVTVFPIDLGVPGKAVPIPKQRVQVMSKAWLKKVLLLRGSVRRSLGMMMSHRVTFEGGVKRYVFTGAAKAVADSLDQASLKLSKYYCELADNAPEVHRVARQILSKNADHLWRTVSHMFPHHPDKLRAPESWKAKMIESVMERQFPKGDWVRSMGIRYSIYRTEDALFVGGRRQRPFPGVIKEWKLVTRALMGTTDEVVKRLMKRVPVLSKEYKSKGLYSVTFQHLERDMMRLLAYNPVEVPGMELKPRVEKLRAEVAALDFERFKVRRELREDFCKHIMEMIIFLQGPWRAERDALYKELFGG